MATELTDLSVYKSNAIIEASYRLTVQEQRVLLACIVQIRKDEPLTDEKMYEVSVNDLADMTGVKRDFLYKELKKATESLFERKIWIHKEPNGDTKPKAPLVTRWVQTAQYLAGEGAIRLRFSKEILPYLNKQFEGFFTRYALTDVVKMDTSHSIRLYELLAQYVKTGQREITLEQLKNWLLLEDKYKTAYDLKRYVIDPSVEQINKITPLKISYEQKKRGRSIHSLLFKVKVDEKVKKEISNENNNKDKPFTLTPSQAAMYANKLSQDSTCQQMARVGEEASDFVERLRKMLLDPETAEQLKPMLIKHGFNPTKKSKEK